MATLQVPDLRARVRDSRTVRTRGQPRVSDETAFENSLALDVAKALRGHMRYAGVRRNPAPHLPQLDERFEQAEADYCKTHNRSRPPAASAFKVRGKEYLFDHAYPLLMHELEFRLAPKERSAAAKALADVLHRHELPEHQVPVAREKLIRIITGITPV